MPYGARAKLPINPDRAGMDIDSLATDGTFDTENGGSPKTMKESKIKESKSRKRKGEKETVHKVAKKPKITE